MKEQRIRTGTPPTQLSRRNPQSAGGRPETKTKQDLRQAVGWHWSIQRPLFLEDGQAGAWPGQRVRCRGGWSQERVWLGQCWSEKRQNTERPARC